MEILESEWNSVMTKTQNTLYFVFGSVNSNISRTAVRYEWTSLRSATHES